MRLDTHTKQYQRRYTEADCKRCWSLLSIPSLIIGTRNYQEEEESWDDFHSKTFNNTSIYILD